MLRHSIAIIILLAAPWVVHAQPMQEPYIEGKDYTLIDKPLRTRESGSGKIEVIEFFWYGCPHCHAFQPLVTQWKDNLSEDVDFWRSPAIWNDAMRLHARAFYTAQALGVNNRLDEALFVALTGGKRLNNAGQIENFFADYGVEREDFRNNFEAFGVISRATQADARMRNYGITGTPMLIINGKYRIPASKGQAHMLQVADFLIDKERQKSAPNVLAPLP